MGIVPTSWVKNPVGTARAELQSAIALLEACTDVCIGVDANGIITLFNHAAEQFTGYSRSELLGKKNLVVILPNRLRKEADETISQFNSDSISSHFECIILNASGSERVMNWSRLKLCTPKNESVYISLGRDITEDRLIQRILEDSEARFRRLAEQAPDIIFRWSFEHGFEYVNSATENILGYSIEAHYKTPGSIYRAVFPDDRNKLSQFLQRLSLGIQPAPFRLRWYSKSKKIVWLELRTSPVKGEDQKVIAIEGVARDVTEQELRREHLEYISYHDALTGLLNKRALDSKIMELEANGTRPVGIIVADLDKLKQVNDTFGHDVGDQLLVICSTTLRRILGTGAIIARTGGDEFIITVPNADDSMMKDICEQLVEEAGVFKMSQIPEQFGSITISYGYSSASDLSIPISSCIKRADKAMYKVKRRHRLGCQD